MASSSLDIGIIGGSISGCAAAIALSQAGHQVTVYERSSRELVGRGAGIGSTPAMLDSLIEKDMIDADFPFFELNVMPFIGCTGADDQTGHTAWNMPISLRVLNWGDLYRNLRRRVPDDRYHAGKAATATEYTDDGKVSVTFDDGSQQPFDLVIFADGYRSMGRDTLFPDVEVKYRGYVLWRGTIPEKELTDNSPLEGILPRLSYKGMAGHVVMYYVPGLDGSIQSGDRIVNWAAYIPVTAEDLPAFLVDKNGHQHESSMPPGMMRPEEEDRLKGLMRHHLPGYYGDLITKSETTFAQPIFTVDMPAYYKDRRCLFGDAGSMAQPFTASGVFKGVSNALDLAEALANHPTPDAALEAWSKAQTHTGKRLVVLGEQMEKAWIWAAADFSEMDEEKTSAWFKAAVQFPEEFSYGDDD